MGNKETHIVGDFNIDLLNDASSDSKRLIRLMENQGLLSNAEKCNAHY